VECPLDCEYLQESRKHERSVPFEASKQPNPDIQVTESFIAKHEPLLSTLAAATVEAALSIPGVIDYDIREALEALARTYRTLQSGVYYETRPTNPLAAQIYDAVQSAAQEFRREEQQNLGMTRTRDSDVLGLIVFLQRIEFDRNNGRRRGRAFLDSMRVFHQVPPTAPVARSSLILP